MLIYILPISLKMGKKEILIINRDDPNFLDSYIKLLKSDFTVKYFSETENLNLIEPTNIRSDQLYVFLCSSAIEAERLRSKLRQTKNLGIIISQQSSVEDELKAFKQGIAQYIVGPIAYPQLRVRIQSAFTLCQRIQISSEKIDSQPTLASQSSLNIQLNEQKLECRLRGRSIKLPPVQFKILTYFLANSGQLIKREDIREKIWSPQLRKPSLRSIDAHISKLKKNLPELEEHLSNIYGQGYVFEKSVPHLSQAS